MQLTLNCLQAKSQCRSSALIVEKNNWLAWFDHCPFSKKLRIVRKMDAQRYTNNQVSGRNKAAVAAKFYRENFIWRGFQKGSSLVRKTRFAEQITFKVFAIRAIRLTKSDESIVFGGLAFLAMLQRLFYYLVKMEFILLTLNQCSCEMLTVFL